MTTTATPTPGNSAKRRTIGLTAGAALLLAATALLLAATFTAGWLLCPSEATDGYTKGKENGYAAGYQDALNDEQPDMHRFMNEADYDTRTLLGGRSPGQ